MSIERTGAVSGYKSHKEINFESKQTLSALLADFRIFRFKIDKMFSKKLPLPLFFTLSKVA